jgi:VWFA-related protein
MKWLVVIQGILLLFLIETARPCSAQPPMQDESQNGIRNFGWSLKRPEKKNANANPLPPAVPEPSVEEGVLKVETNLIVSDAFVYDKKGRPVDGLNQRDFRVEEDGAAQHIEFFSNGRDASIPRSIILIIDYSASQLPYLETSIRAGQVLVSMLNPQDRMAIVTDDVDLLTGFTSDKSLLKERLDSLKKRVGEGRVGKSKQFSSLMAALNELFSEDDLRPVVIFQTDGDEFGEIQFAKGKSDETKRQFTYDDVLKSIERTRATVYTVIPGVRLNEASGEARLELARKEVENSMRSMRAFRKLDLAPDPRKYEESFLRRWTMTRTRDADAVSKLAIESGGLAEYIEQPEQASAIYARILTEMNRRYVIGYYPTNTKRDGKRRNIKISVESDQKLKIRGKTSYIAGGPAN